MRCKSCNAELAQVDLNRKEEDGTHTDLCSPCYHASQWHMLEQTGQLAGEIPPAEVPVGTPQERFEAFVVKADLKKSWRDGLGLMSAEKRLTLMYNKCFGSFLELLQLGYPDTIALERACGMHRADRRRDHEGAGFAFSGASEQGEGMGGASQTEHKKGEFISH